MNINSILTDVSAHLIGLYGKTDLEMLKSFDQQFKKMLEDKKNKAYILLTSAGGPFETGRGLCERLRILSKHYDLKIIGVGTVMSQAVNMLVSVPLKRRYLTSGTIVMVHQPQNFGDLKLPEMLSSRLEVLEEFKSDMQHCQDDYDRMIDHLSKNTGQTADALRELAKYGTYMTADKAVELGFAYKILDED